MGTTPGWGLLLSAWELASRTALARYRRKLGTGAAVNAETLRGILARNRNAGFGRRHDFGRLARARDLETAWRDAVPVSDYEAFREDIGRIAGGAPDVLFAGRPRMLVSTSGTTGDPKLFPVTTRQQNAALWYIALLTPAARAAGVPGLGFRQRTATLMVASRPGRTTEAGIPVGNPSGAGIRRILALAPPFWVFPPAVLLVQHYPSALYLHALFALRAADLGCIEAIYCSHVVSWMGLIERRADDLVRDLAAGTLTPDLELTAEEQAAILPRLRPEPVRAQAVEAALRAGPAGLMARLWPELRVISSVVTGAFAVSAPRLRWLAGPGPAFYTTCFGATEGMVGINLEADTPERYTLALGAAHFEFLPEEQLDAATPRTVGIPELVIGARYEIVITTHAGLYRYRLGDVVRIAGFTGTTPVFEFDHRRGNVLDLVGEKTTEQHVRDAVRRLVGELPGGESSLTDYTVTPELGSIPYHYVAYAERGDREQPGWDREHAARRLDALLAEENPSYATLARANGRLGPLELRMVPPGTFDRLLAERRAAVAGINANQVKVPRVLRDESQRDFLEKAVAAGPEARR